MATAPKIPMPTPIHEVENVLAFRTPPGGETIQAGHMKDLEVVDTSRFDKIRLVADERIGSTCNVQVRLTITEGKELVAFLDQIMLTPHAQVTRVYDVPGTHITVSIDGVPSHNANAKGTVDVLIYGQF
jgi:hypothetical protein